MLPLGDFASLCIRIAGIPGKSSFSVITSRKPANERGDPVINFFLFKIVFRRVGCSGLPRYARNDPSALPLGDFASLCIRIAAMPISHRFVSSRAVSLRTSVVIQLLTSF